MRTTKAALVLLALLAVTASLVASKEPHIHVRIRSVSDSKTLAATTSTPTAKKTPSLKLEDLGSESSEGKPLVKSEPIPSSKSKMHMASLHNRNTYKEAKCFLRTNEMAYTKARAVMRAVFVRDGRRRFCTAWLWGNKGHIVSNNHCFSSQVTVDNARFEFLVETPTCRDTCKRDECPVGKVLLGEDNVQFVESDPHLDYAVLQITNNASEYVDTFGYLQLRDSGDCHVGEQIYIPQHPHGFSKKVAMTDDDLGVRPASIKETNKTVSAENSVQLVGLVGYKADTEGGSSSSPVILRESHLVVALHHHGGDRNSGTPSNLLVAPFRKISSDNDGFKTSDS